MANEIKHKFSNSAPFNITLSGLIGSTGVNPIGRQSDFVDNTSTRYQSLLIYARLQQSGTVSGSRAGYIYGLRDDGSGHTTDGAGTGDGVLNILNAPLVGVLGNKFTPAAGDLVYGEFIYDAPGPKFAVAVSQDMCGLLSDIATGNYVRWVGVNPEIQ